MTATASLAIRVFEPVAVTAETLTEGAVNQVYSASVSAIGGLRAVRLGVTGGALPAGVSLGPAGVVAGTPTQSGAFTFTASATDAAAPSQAGAGADHVERRACRERAERHAGGRHARADYADRHRRRAGRVLVRDRPGPPHGGVNIVGATATYTPASNYAGRTASRSASRRAR